MGPTWNGTGMKWDQHEMGQTWNGPLWHELGQTDMKWDQHEMGRAWNGTLGHEMGLTWNGTDMKWPDMIWPTWFGPTWNGRAWNGIYPIPIQHTYQYLGLVIHQFRSTSEDSWWKSHLARPILWFQHLQNQFQLLKRLESATLSIWGGLCHISLSMHSIKV